MIAEEVASQYADEVDIAARFPHEAVAALRESRLLGVMVPRDLGGEGANLAEIAECCNILGRSCAATGMIYAMHQIQVSGLIPNGAEESWHREFLAHAAADQILIASATTELGVGGDLRRSLCAIERSGDTFSLEKQATVISYGEVADAFLATARTHADAPTSDQVMALITREQCTLTKISDWNTLGMRGTCSDGYTLRAKAPVCQILPKAYSSTAARAMLAVSHLLWGALWLGIAADAFSRAQKFIRTEGTSKSSGPSPASLRLAAAAGKLQRMTSCLRHAIADYECARHCEKALNSFAFSIAMNNVKTGLSEIAIEVVQTALLVCGIQGYRNNSPYSVARHIRDILSAPIMINNDRILANTATLLLMQSPANNLA